MKYKSYPSSNIDNSIPKNLGHCLVLTWAFPYLDSLLALAVRIVQVGSYQVGTLT